MADRSERRGPGRWTPTQKPYGVLWTNDATIVGFEPIPAPESNPQPVLDAIATSAGTPTEVFDQLAEQFGSKVTEGNLNTWAPNPKVKA